MLNRRSENEEITGKRHKQIRKRKSMLFSFPKQSWRSTLK